VTLRRVLIVGSGGSGKTTLARELGRITGLPVIHLDLYYWKTGWTAEEPGRWRNTVARLAAEPAWIMDGNYGSTMDLRLPRADTVILLDTPRLISIARVIRRRLGRERPDLAPGCPPKVDWQFIRWIWTYGRRSRPRVLKRIEERGAEVAYLRLRRRRQIEAFFDRVRSSAERPSR
jgi:adenylate kinase family enzyme